MSALIHTMIGKHHLKPDMPGEFFEQSVTKMLDHYTAPAAEHLHIPLVVEGEQGNDQLPQGFLAADPGHETIQRHHPRSGAGRFERCQIAPLRGSDLGWPQRCR